MRFEDRALRIERGRNGNGEPLREYDDFGLRAGPGHAAARDDDRPLGCVEQPERFVHVFLLRGGSIRWNALESIVYEKLELAFGYRNFGVMSEKLQIHRPGGTAHCFAKRLAH